MLYIAFVCIFLSIFLFTYNKNHLSKKKKDFVTSCTCPNKRICPYLTKLNTVFQSYN